MQAVIIEDEKPAARRLQRMLEKLDVKVLVNLHSIEEAVAWFENNPHPELIFLDIQLSDGLSFEIFEKTRVKAAVIFTTAYDEYALKAFKLNSVDYLLKPIDDEELEAALAKFKQNHQSVTERLDIAGLRNLLQQPEQNYKKRFSIQLGQHIKLIEVENISCFYSENKGTYLHTTQNRSYLLDCSLEKLETELDPSQFFRINRKFIIKLNDIADILRYSNQRLELKLKNFSQEQLVVSRERVKAFKDWLEE
ncbi:LytR/AlgR family response regulator transcription factor [Salegentibacter sp. HM20]